MKTLVLDIETRPHLGYVWSLWQDNMSLGAVVETGSVICFAAKWLGERKVEYYSDFHHGHETMILRAWELIDEADAIVHYNGRAFDMKHLNREFLVAGLTPPSPHQDIDLYTAVKAKFKFASNKLAHVSKQLGLGGKVETGGFELWLGCMAGDPKAWAKMKKYNIGDVRLTEQVHNILLPWIPRYPNVALHDGKAHGCPKCGSKHVTRQGVKSTGAGTFQQYKCQDCGGWSRAAQRTFTTALRNVS